MIPLIHILMLVICVYERKVIETSIGWNLKMASKIFVMCWHNAITLEILSFWVLLYLHRLVESTVLILLPRNEVLIFSLLLRKEESIDTSLCGIHKWKLTTNSRRGKFINSWYIYPWNFFVKWFLSWPAIHLESLFLLHFPFPLAITVVEK